VLADSEEFAPTAVLEHCGKSLKECAEDAHAASECDKLEFPITASCSLPVTRTPAADSKGVTVRVDIPPLQYNTRYRLRLSLVKRQEIPLTVGSLQRVDARVTDTIKRLADGEIFEPSAMDVCRSLVQAIQSEFADKSVQIDAPLKSCADGIAPNDQIALMEMRIEDAVNARFKLLEAQNRQALAANATGENGRDVRSYKEQVSAAEAQYEATLRALRPSIREVVSTNTWMPIPIATVADAATTRMAHISGDAGVVYGWDLDKSFTTLGANIYTRPVNTSVSLAALKAEGMLTWRHRFSFTLGATLTSIDEAGERKGIIGSSALVAGVGWRLTDVIRVSAGGLVFEEQNPNPLVTNDFSMAVSPYIGLSFDLDVAKALGRIFAGTP
jgi:hypothetical protein